MTRRKIPVQKIASKKRGLRGKPALQSKFFVYKIAGKRAGVRGALLEKYPELEVRHLAHIRRAHPQINTSFEDAGDLRPIKTRPPPTK